MPAGGGVIQIAAIGRQNEHLNANPEFTLFKTVHSRYTNFAEDYEENDFTAGSVGFGQKVSCTISRYGDLIDDILMEVQLPAISAPSGLQDASGNAVSAGDSAAYWVNAIGYAMLDQVEVEIGGSSVDTIYSEWMYFWEELTQRPGARLAEQIGKFPYGPDVEDSMIEFASKPRNLYVPLPFWFNKYFMENGLSIPLIALTYHEIKIKVTFRSMADLTCVVYKDTDSTWGDYWKLSASSMPTNTMNSAPLAISDLKGRLLVSYVYLDTEERNAFASVEHQYLITIIQQQTSSITSTSATTDQIKLYFNHPSNLLTWFIRPNNWNTEAGRRRYSIGYKDRFDFSLKKADDTKSLFGDAVDPIKSASLTLNGHDRFPAQMPGMFFRTVQPSTKWENIPTGFLYVFTFALYGGQWNPTSTLNFSRIDHVQLQLDYAAGMTTSEVLIFAESYNLLVIKDGMGGVRYSN